MRQPRFQKYDDSISKYDDSIAKNNDAIAALLPQWAHDADSPREAMERPRERLERHGPDALTDVDLLALILRTGARGHCVDAVAKRMLDEHGGLNGLARAASRDVVAACGVGPAKSASLVAALEIGRRIATRVLAPGHAFAGPADVFHAYHARLRDLRHERFLAILLDGRHRVMRDVLISQGTLTASLVHPREVFRPALREAAAAIVLVHNHPSGDPTPSEEDREITRRLVAAGELLGVRVLDHVVVAERGYQSLAVAGVVPSAAR